MSNLAEHFTSDGWMHVKQGDAENHPNFIIFLNSCGLIHVGSRGRALYGKYIVLNSLTSHNLQCQYLLHNFAFEP